MIKGGGVDKIQLVYRAGVEPQKLLGLIYAPNLANKKIRIDKAVLLDISCLHGENPVIRLNGGKTAVYGEFSQPDKTGGDVRQYFIFIAVVGTTS